MSDNIDFNRKRIITLAPRLLFGLMFAGSGLSKLLAPAEILMQGYGNGAPFMMSLQETGYLFTLLTVTEIVAGGALLVGRYVSLALAVLAPIVVNIVGFHLFIDVQPMGYLVAVIVAGLEVHLAWRHRAAFLPLLKP